MFSYVFNTMFFFNLRIKTWVQRSILCIFLIKEVFFILDTMESQSPSASAGH